MASRAQGLESAEAKRIPVASMRLDVVGDGRGRDDAAALAHDAERVLLELQGAAAAPDVELVPLAPWSTRVGRWNYRSATDGNFPAGWLAAADRTMRFVCHSVDGRDLVERRAGQKEEPAQRSDFPAREPRRCLDAGKLTTRPAGADSPFLGDSRKKPNVCLRGRASA